MVKFLLLALFLFLLPAPNVYFYPVAATTGLALDMQIVLPSPPPYPINKSGEPPPFVTAGAVLIQDIPSGVIFYARNENVRFPPASTTKVMTALVSLDNYKLDDTITVPETTLDGSLMKLIPGETMTVESLLYGALVHSANDAAYTLAVGFPGGMNAFVQKMNEKAKSLHLSDTHYTNPMGYDGDNHYSTASDLTKQTLAALTNKTFTKIVGTKSITVSDTSYTYFHDLKNVNELLGKIPGVMGVKTGFTTSAGEILISEVRKNGQSVLFVVLKSADRFGETTKLIDWVFGNFTWVPVSEIIPASQK